MKKELGRLLLDIAKYIITAIILARIFGEFDNDFELYFCASVTIIVLALIGLWLTEDDKKTKKKKK